MPSLYSTINSSIRVIVVYILLLCFFNFLSFILFFSFFWFFDNYFYFIFSFNIFWTFFFSIFFYFFLSSSSPSLKKSSTFCVISYTSSVSYSNVFYFLFIFSIYICACISYSSMIFFISSIYWLYYLDYGYTWIIRSFNVLFNYSFRFYIFAGRCKVVYVFALEYFNIWFIKILQIKLKKNKL